MKKIPNNIELLYAEKLKSIIDDFCKSNDLELVKEILKNAKLIQCVLYGADFESDFHMPSLLERQMIDMKNKNSFVNFTLINSSKNSSKNTSLKNLFASKDINHLCIYTDWAEEETSNPYFMYFARKVLLGALMNIFKILDLDTNPLLISNDADTVSIEKNYLQILEDFSNTSKIEHILISGVQKTPTPQNLSNCYELSLTMYNSYITLYTLHYKEIQSHGGNTIFSRKFYEEIGGYPFQGIRGEHNELVSLGLNLGSKFSVIKNLNLSNVCDDRRFKHYYNLYHTTLISPEWVKKGDGSDTRFGKLNFINNNFDDQILRDFKIILVNGLHKRFRDYRRKYSKYIKKAEAVIIIREQIKFALDCCEHTLKQYALKLEQRDFSKISNLLTLLLPNKEEFEVEPITNLFENIQSRCRSQVDCYLKDISLDKIHHI